MSNLPYLLRHSLQAPGADNGSAGGGDGYGLDFTLAKDNLHAFGKLWATSDDAPVFSAFH